MPVVYILGRLGIDSCIAVTPVTSALATPISRKTSSGCPLLRAALWLVLVVSSHSIGAAEAVQAAAGKIVPAGTGDNLDLRDAEPPPGGPVVSQSALSRPFLDAIHRLEGDDGAYAQGLSEHLLGLGLTLQRQGRHGEALDAFKRGVHLARINHGLYSAEQIPLLKAEIASHVARGELAVADERQQYLYRVQVRSLDRGEVMANALMQQAHWQYSAYRLGIGGPDFMRLMNMWDLYRLALNDIVGREGENSSELLPPLYGMLRTQYLITNYRGEDQSSGFNTGEGYAGSVEYNRFNAYRNDSYDKGRAVIQAIYDIRQEAEDPVEAAESLVMLGDWLLWNDKRQSAMQAYQDAMAELATLEDAQQEMDRLLGQPVALPSLDGLSPLPKPVEPDAADILLEFAVTSGGRVSDLERLDDNEEYDGVANRLMRLLRKTPFRPRFDQGEPVPTEQIVRAYAVAE